MLCIYVTGHDDEPSHFTYENLAYLLPYCVRMGVEASGEEVFNPSSVYFCELSWVQVYLHFPVS